MIINELEKFVNANKNQERKRNAERRSKAEKNTIF